MQNHLKAVSTNHADFTRLRESCGLSFEFFPPKNDRMQRCLWRNIGQLELLGPKFFSVTYGAGGSDRERSMETLSQMQLECPVPLAAHITFSGHSQTEVLEIASRMYDQGIRSLVALRGDAEPVKNSFKCTEDFISALRELADFDISVAAYPEVHPLAESPQADLEQLKRKLQSGASRAISQYFFDVDNYLRFRDRAAGIGIENALVPGILPIHNFERVLAFSERCGTHVPERLKALFEGTEGNLHVQHKLSSELTVNMCDRLLSEGVKDLHFYTLNTPTLSFEVARQLGIPLSSRIANAA